MTCVLIDTCFLSIIINGAPLNLQKYPCVDDKFCDPFATERSRCCPWRRNVYGKKKSYMMGGGCVGHFYVEISGHLVAATFVITLILLERYLVYPVKSQKSKKIQINTFETVWLPFHRLRAPILFPSFRGRTMMLWDGGVAPSLGSMFILKHKMLCGITPWKPQKSRNLRQHKMNKELSLKNIIWE